MTFSNNPNLVYSLTAVPTITNENCAALVAGQSCVIYSGAILVLTLEANGTTQVTLNIDGMASDTGVGGLAGGNPYIGSFTESLSGIPGSALPPTPAGIQMYFCGTNNDPTAAQCSANGVSITSTQSGNFTASAVPEPTTPLMLGCGLVALAFVVRRRKTS